MKAVAGDGGWGGEVYSGSVPVAGIAVQQLFAGSEDTGGREVRPPGWPRSDRPTAGAKRNRDAGVDRGEGRSALCGIDPVGERVEPLVSLTDVPLNGGYLP